MPEESKASYQAMIDTGFTEWSLTDYKQFFRAFRKRGLADLDGLASEIESKSVEEVAAYALVFEERYHELKERDQIALKL